MIFTGEAHIAEFSIMCSAADRVTHTHTHTYEFV